jgi:hypothetical protein
MASHTLAGTGPTQRLPDRDARQLIDLHSSKYSVRKAQKRQGQDGMTSIQKRAFIIVRRVVHPCIRVPLNLIGMWCRHR